MTIMIHAWDLAEAFQSSLDVFIPCQNLADTSLAVMILIQDLVEAV